MTGTYKERATMAETIIATTDLNARQQRVLELLRERRDRELYEGAAPPMGKHGSGQFWVTHSADAVYSALGWEEVRDMERRGLIVERWPGCYRLPPSPESKP
jgi:hypothetical protein